jgi:hypothetical protein
MIATLQLPFLDLSKTDEADRERRSRERTPAAGRGLAATAADFLTDCLSRAII